MSPKEYKEFLELEAIRRKKYGPTPEEVRASAAVRLVFWSALALFGVLMLLRGLFGWC